jgi:hypothetical protein
LGDEFWEELNSFISKAALNPRHFHLEKGDLRRANLIRFPYHFFSGKLQAVSVSRWFGITGSVRNAVSPDDNLSSP